MTKPKHLQDPNKPPGTHGGSRPRIGAAIPAEWTVPQDQELETLRAEGLSLLAISIKLHRSEGVVSRRCRQLGLTVPKPGPPKQPPVGAPKPEKKPPPVMAPRAGPVTLAPLPSLQEPLYVIPHRVTPADLRGPPRARSSQHRSDKGSDHPPHTQNCR